MKEDFLLRVKYLSKIISESDYRNIIQENRYIDIALDHLSQYGGDFNSLNELDKLILMSSADDEDGCKKLSLSKIYSVNNSFGKRKVKIRIKPINEQPINHELSQKYAGKEGFLFPYVHYVEEKWDPDYNKIYASVQFDGLQQYSKDYRDVGYDSSPIFLDNMYPIGYDDDQTQFAAHDKKRSDEYDALMSRMYGDKYKPNPPHSSFNSDSEYK